MSTYAVTKIKRLRTQHIRRIRQLLAETFGLSKENMGADEQAWKKWVSTLGYVDNEDLEKVLKSEAREVFKARVIAIAWAPSDEMEPFQWPSHHRGTGIADLVRFSEYSPKLRQFALAVLEIGIGTAKIAGTDRFYKRWYHYRSVIIRALMLLEERDPVAQRLFECYQVYPSQLNDSAWAGPFRLIMGAGISEKWKRLADERMRAWIRSSLADTTLFSRREIFAHYLQPMSERLQNGKAHYSIELFASQMEFLVSVSYGVLGRSGYFLKQLSEALYKDLRHRVVRSVVLNRDREFDVFYSDTEQLAKDFLVEFRDDDELCNRIHELFKEAAARKEGYRIAARERERKDAHQKSTFQKLL